MSGSGVYIYNERERESRKLVAIFSSYISIRNGNNYKKLNLEANIAIRLTSKKIRRICKWMKAGYNCSLIRERGGYY